ncbi:MAG: CoB--CoM heterodisulfide reductase subunit B [Promethearchaeota archaeon]
MKYSFYLGCVIPNRYPFIERATRSLLKEFDVELIEMEGAACCPAPGVFRSFDIPSWLLLGARNICIAESNDADIVTMCNGCYGTLLEVNHHLHHDLQKREMVNKYLKEIGKEFKASVKVKHLMEVLYFDLGLKKIQDAVINSLGLKCAVHYGCHLLKPSDIRPWGGETEDPRFFDEIVEALGCESIEYKDKMMCCGAGGALRTADKKVSLDFTRHKLEMMRQAGAECIVDCCPFCQLQLDIGQVEVNNTYKDEIGEPYNLPVFYISQLIGLSMGLNPIDMGLVKRHEMGGVPPMIDQEPLLIKLFDRLGYDYLELKKKANTND